MSFEAGPSNAGQAPRLEDQNAQRTASTFPVYGQQQLPQMTQQMPQQVAQQMPQQMAQQMPQQVGQQMPQQVGQQMPQQQILQQQMVQPNLPQEQIIQQELANVLSQMTQQQVANILQQMPQRELTNVIQQVLQNMQSSVPTKKEEPLPAAYNQQKPVTEQILQALQAIINGSATIKIQSTCPGVMNTCQPRVPVHVNSIVPICNSVDNLLITPQVVLSPVIRARNGYNEIYVRPGAQINFNLVDPTPSADAFVQTDVPHTSTDDSGLDKSSSSERSVKRATLPRRKKSSLVHKKRSRKSRNESISNDPKSAEHNSSGSTSSNDPESPPDYTRKSSRLSTPNYVGKTIAWQNSRYTS